MQAIKALVIFMGVLLVAGLGLLGYGMYTKAAKTVKVAPVAVSGAASGAAIPSAGDGGALSGLEAFGTVGLDQPAGTSIVALTVAGRQIVLTLRGGGLADRVVVVDSAEKGVIGQVMLGAVEAAAKTADDTSSDSGYAAPPAPGQ